MEAPTAHSPSRSLLFGILLALPFLVLNAVVGKRIEPVYSWIDPVGPFILTAVLLLGLLGSVVALSPLFRKKENTRNHFYLANAIVGFVLLAFFITISIALGEEIYRCDILGIPNCD